MDNKENISIKYIGYVAGKLGIASKKIVIKNDNNKQNSKDANKANTKSK